MIHDLKMELYWRLPVYFQERALSLYAGKLNRTYYGSEYAKFKEWLQGWQDWSPSFIEEWKNERLQYIVSLAAKQVPYYQKAYKDRSWEKVRSENDLHLLPVVEKQSMRQNEHAFLVEGKDPGALWMEKTSGTTGTSQRIYWPMAMAQQWWAVTEVMVRYVAGVAQEMPRAMVGGRPVVRGKTRKPPYWRFNSRWNQLYLSSYHISNNTAPDYITALKRYGSQWMTGYGSSIAALAESAMEYGLPPLPLKSVIVSGDTLLNGMRSSIEKYFQCKCFDHYGQCEGIVMAMECSHGRMHMIPVLGIIEILREDGSPCSSGEVGEIVATSLLNDAMPLIRYRTGDYAAWAVQQHCLCGNQNPIIAHLEGRIDDYLVTSDGRKVGRLSTAMKRSPTIHSAQLVQEKPGHAYLLVRPGSGYKRTHAAAVKDDILERIGKFEIDIVECSEIPKTLSGKTILVVRLEERPDMKKMYAKLLSKNL